jgi:hypothetical protein
MASTFMGIHGVIMGWYHMCFGVDFGVFNRILLFITKNMTGYSFPGESNGVT